MNLNINQEHQLVAVLDFETADNEENNFHSYRMHSSANQIGWQVVSVGDGQASLHKESGSQLLRPPQNFYSGWDKHGIKPRDTADAPSFLEFWSQTLKPVFDGLNITTLVAHNTSFDAKVFIASLGNKLNRGVTHSSDHNSLICESLKSPDGRSYEWVCTKKMSGGLKLVDAAALFGVEHSEENHHNAEHDAKAAAEVLIHLLSEDKNKGKSSSSKAVEMEGEVTFSGLGTPAGNELAGRTFKVTGSLKDRSGVFQGRTARKQAEEHIRARGGRIASKITDNTILVISSDTTKHNATNDNASQRKLTEARQKGLTVLTEDELVDVLKTGNIPMTSDV